MSDQGYSTFKLLDGAGNEVFNVPDYGGIVGPPTLGQPVFCARLAVTSAQLLALNTTPLVLAPTPAPVSANPPLVAQTAKNFCIIPISLSLHYLYATAAYTTTGGTLRVSYGPVANTNYICADQSAILTNTANEMNPSIILTSTGVLTEANGLAQSIYLVNPGTNFTAGGGSLVVYFTYHLAAL
jgi:hypothetical protein